MNLGYHSAKNGVVALVSTILALSSLVPRLVSTSQATHLVPRRLFDNHTAELVSGSGDLCMLDMSQCAAVL
ncbi:hypothetical protein EDC01DRAFT_679203 [Geopyxis carbonaria]|nr:hypothetical protein EDC01DRAFT_679203 [Geopyxis carbonaria]